MTDDWDTPEIVRALKRLEEGQARTEGKVDNIASGFVPRSEFEARMTAQDREIRDIKAAASSSRLSPLAVASTIISFLTLILALVIAVAVKP